MEREDLKKLLAEIEKVIARSHVEIISASANVKKALGVLEKEDDALALLNLLSKSVKGKFRALLLDELSNLAKSEIMLKGLGGDILNIIHDVDDGKISKSTRRLLGRVHLECNFYGGILVQSVGEMAVGEVTGMALMLIGTTVHD